MAQTTHEVCQAYINNCLSEWDSSLDCNAKEILHKALFSASEAGDIRFIRYEEVDSSYDPDRDIVQKKDAFLLKGSLLKSLLHEYAPGYSAPMLFRVCKVSICSLSSALPKRFALTAEPM